MLADCEEYEKIEIIHGVEYQMAPARINHVRVRGNIEHIFRNYLSGKRCEAFSEAGVFFENNDLLIPDVMIVCDKSKIHYDGIHGAPDLVVEILSPSTGTIDKTIKKDIYESIGVKEYWIVDPKAQSIEVYKLKDSRFYLDEMYHALNQIEWDAMPEKDRQKMKLSLKVSLYDDLDIPLKDIFAGVE